MQYRRLHCLGFARHLSISRQLSDTLGLSIEELIGRERKKTAARPTVKRGPTPRIQQQLEAVNALPRAKQRAVMQVLDAVLQQQASR